MKSTTILIAIGTCIALCGGTACDAAGYPKAGQWWYVAAVLGLAASFVVVLGLLRDDGVRAIAPEPPRDGVYVGYVRADDGFTLLALYCDNHWRTNDGALDAGTKIYETPEWAKDA
jgi:hypothetical protein